MGYGDWLDEPDVVEFEYSLAYIRLKLLLL
jgi:hypothetical protein